MKNKLMKILKFSFIGLIVLLLTLSLAISFLLFTNTGSQSLLSVAKKFESRLNIELVDGSLFNSPLYEQIGWQDGETSIEIESLSYEFDWLCLFNNLCLESLKVDGAVIKLPTTSEQVEEETVASEESIEIDLPIDIHIEDVNLSRINIVMGELSIDLNALSLKAFATGNNVSLSSKINGLLVTLPDAEKQIVTSNKTSTSATSQKKKMDLNIESIPALVTQEMLPTVNLPINIDLDSFTLEKFKVVQNKASLFEINTFNTQLTFKETELTINDFDLDLPETQVKLDGQLNFIDDYPLSLNITGQVKNIKQLQPQDQLSNLNYELSTNGTLSDLNTDLILSNKLDVQLSSHLNLMAENLPHSIQLDWKKIHWPLTGEPQFTSKEGTFSSKGALTDHIMRLQTEYTIAQMPSGKVNLKTQGDLQQLNVENLTVNTLNGEIDLSGLLTWKDKIDWVGQLKLTEINLQELETAYNGYFSGIINQQVEVVLYENSEPDWQFDFPSLQVNGELLDRPLTLSGRVSGNNQQGINFDNLNLNNAENTFVINGTFAEQSNLDIDLNITDLSHAVLQATGQIKGNINIKGPMDELDISSELSAQKLSYETYQVEKLALQSTVLITENPSLSLNLEATNIKVNEQLIDDVDVQVTNAKTETDNIKHTIDLLLNSELVSTDLTLDVTQTEKSLLTEFNQAIFYLPEQDLSLLKPFSVTQNGNNINLTEHCWQVKASSDDNGSKQNAGKLCINKFDVGETGDIAFDLDKYLFTNVNPFLPEELRLAGAVSANAIIAWEKQQKPNFTAKITSDDLLLKINSEEKTKTINEYPLQTFNIDVQGNQQNILVDANVFSEKLVNINVDADLTPYATSPQINSNINIKLPDFELFLPLIPQLEMLKGQLNSQLQVTGNLNKPLINGEVKIENGLISAPDLPMKIYELQTLVNIDDTKATLDGSFNTSSDNNTVGEKVANIPLLTNTLSILDKSVKKIGSKIIQQDQTKTSVINNAIPGLALIKGEFDWSKEVTGNVEISGHKLEIYDYGKIDLFISPEISVSMDENINVKGDLTIDRGKLVIKEVPAGAVSESKDIIVVDVEKEKIVPSLPMIIDLNIYMGEDFQLVALGLDTFINGNLIVKQPLKKDLTINGALSFVDGSYRSLGQQLVLQESRVVFQGAPESPYLSIEAIRDPDNVEDDVTAGVRVTGTPDQLELEIFSDPGMSQQQALSYLTRGKALDSSSESSSIANMLIDIAAGQSDGLMSSIGEGIGIKDLSLSSSGSGDEQSVGVRGEIAPGIELSYGVGVFDSFSIFAIRYKLFEKFYIEASSGVDQAIDAYYEWDWD